MKESLYQRGSSSAAEGGGVTASTGRVKFDVSVATIADLPCRYRAVSPRPSALSPFEGEDVRLTHSRIEAHVVPVAAPHVRGVSEQISRDAPVVVNATRAHAAIRR